MARTVYNQKLVYIDRLAEGTRIWPKTTTPPHPPAETRCTRTPGRRDDTARRLASAGMTPEQLAEAKQYGRYSLACTLADKVLDLLFLTFAAVVLARPLDDWLQGSSLLDRIWSLRLVVFFLLVTLLHMAVSLPLSFYSGYILEHRFQLSTLSVGGWVRTLCEAEPAGPGLGHRC